MLFNQIIAPLQDLLTKEAELLDGDASTYKLSLPFFTLNLLYAVIMEVGSISLLITEIKTSPQAKALNLVHVSKSMYSEAFARYDPKIFRRIFLGLLERLTFSEIPEIEKLGRFILVDGSIFPAFSTMEWASYKSTSNALKMHLAFELNRMIPVQFINTDANGCEKKALMKMLEAGVTYIADRGYVSFNLFQQIVEQQAFFIIRIKSTMKETVVQSLDVIIPEEWPPFFVNISDSMIYFSNDPNKSRYRLVSFVFENEAYRIATNRTDLTTGEIIMLYAYRWQIELFFRSIKRTFHALHLWSHNEKGIETQFYIYMIVYLLLLHFKQGLVQEQMAADILTNEPDSKKPDSTSPQNHSTRTPARGLVTLLGGRLKKFWKMSVHWLKCVRNFLFQPLTQEVKAVIFNME
jgi:hypothetical protein